MACGYKTHGKIILFRNKAELKMERNRYLWDSGILLQVSNI